MSSTEKKADDALTPAGNSSRLRVGFQHLAVTALVIGLVAAALIYAFVDDTGPDAAAEIASGRVYEYNIERIGGKSAVYAARFNQWLGGLWHGRTLAYTVAAIAIVVAAICLVAAHLATPNAAGTRVDESEVDGERRE
ncbi:MAG TPA: hypothetical protein VIL19_05110 [Casimicrobiaceae bacterium]